MPRPLALVLFFLIGAGAALGQPGAPGTPAGRSQGATNGAAKASPSRSARTSPAEEAPVYYVVRERPQVFSHPDSSLTLTRLNFREGVEVIEQRGAWSRILKDDVIGWVASEALSDVWILMDKESRTLYVYRGAMLVRKLPADVSQNPEADKVRRAVLGEREHYRIPEGSFFICGKNTESQYYRSLMLNYPNEEDAERGFTAGIISRSERDEIVRSALGFRSPPMGTKLGGAIAIHGQGSGRRRAWTRGCVALRDVHLDAIWDLVEVGTPVLIQ